MNQETFCGQKWQKNITVISLLVITEDQKNTHPISGNVRFDFHYLGTLGYIGWINNLFQHVFQSQLPLEQRDRSSCFRCELSASARWYSSSSSSSSSSRFRDVAQGWPSGGGWGGVESHHCWRARGSMVLGTVGPEGRPAVGPEWQPGCRGFQPRGGAGIAVGPGSSPQLADHSCTTAQHSAAVVSGR